MRRSLLLVALVIVAGCGADDPVPARLKARLDSVLDIARKEPTPDEVRDALLRQLRQAPLPDAEHAPSGTTPFPSRETIRDFYARHADHLVWSDGTHGTVTQTATLLGALRSAGDHGLVPQDYAVERLEALEREIRAKGRDDRAAERLADFDLLATTAFFRYASDLSTGRIHPDEVQRDWHTNPPELDLVKALEDALARGDLARLIASLPPPHPGYARLCQGLGKLREIEAAGGWSTIPPGAKIGPGSRGERVALLRHRLGDSSPGETFDAALASSVRHFQTAHGIDADGVVSAQTLEELNVPAGERIRQVELNLERWRWIPRELGDPHVLVNIPGFDLELARSGAPSWRTRVVTGKAYTPTPVFSDRIVSIVVHPPWNVPESIAVGEYLPDLRKDPRTLARQGFRLLEGSGDHPRELDPGSVNWRDVDAEHFPYRLRQNPGERNPLGQLKFDLTNDFHVYLHDTPAGGAFGRTDRDLSHGCIRVQNALELADQITSAAIREKVHEALEQPEERHIALEAKVPVHILYWTAWADEAGELHFGPDVYGFDRSQREALDRVAGKNAVAQDISPRGSYH